jgi:hypothetical protein
MPHYEVHYRCGLNNHQMKAFASSLTTLHSRLFSVASSTVTITFHRTNITYTSFVRRMRVDRDYNNYPLENTQFSTVGGEGEE